MQKTLFFISAFFILNGFITPSGIFLSQEKELIDCVKKYRSEWGRKCSACKQEGKTYTVFLKNDCSEAVDVKCAVQEAEKRWRTFIKLNMNPKDSMSAYACNGTGKYLYWVRKAGDKSNPLPEDEEINQQYAK